MCARLGVLVFAYLNVLVCAYVRVVTNQTKDVVCMCDQSTDRTGFSVGIDWSSMPRWLLGILYGSV